MIDHINVTWYISDYARKCQRLEGTIKSIIKQGNKLQKFVKTDHTYIINNSLYVETRYLGEKIDWDEYKTKYLKTIKP